MQAKLSAYVYGHNKITTLECYCDGSREETRERISYLMSMTNPSHVEMILSETNQETKIVMSTTNNTLTIKCCDHGIIPEIFLRCLITSVKTPMPKISIVNINMYHLTVIYELLEESSISGDTCVDITIKSLYIHPDFINPDLIMSLARKILIGVKLEHTNPEEDVWHIARQPSIETLRFPNGKVWNFRGQDDATKNGHEFVNLIPENGKHRVRDLRILVLKMLAVIKTV